MTERIRLSLLCIVIGFSLATPQAESQQQQQQQQQTAAQPQAPQQGQGQPDPRQLELLKKLGLSRNMKGPPDWALGGNRHFSPAAPANFPIAVYSSNVIATNFMNSTKGAPSAGLSIATKDSPTIVNQFYHSALRSGGWTVQAPSAEAQAKMGSGMYMLRGQKEKQMTSITITARPGESGSNIAISWYITQ